MNDNNQNFLPSATIVEKEDQYSLSQIIGIWAAAAVPMGILGWVVAPALSPDFTADPLGAGTVRFAAILVGLIWQFILSMILVYREEGDLRLSTIKRRLRLNTPRDPKTGQPRRRLFLWLIPTIILLHLSAAFIFPALDDLWVSVFPFLAEPPAYSGSGFLQSPEVQAQLVGAWWFLGLLLLVGLFNYFLGEEFLFHGILLPKMAGVFGKWDWVANGVLFAVYHLHQPWGWPGLIIGSVFFESFLARRFRSTWMSIIPHATEFWYIILVLAIVLGLM